MSTQVINAITDIIFRGDRIAPKNRDEERVYTWIITLDVMLKLGSIPCMKTEDVNSEGYTKQLCHEGVSCHHARVYCLFKHLYLLNYDLASEVEYQNFYDTGLCGCPYRHEYADLNIIDQETKSILTEELIKKLLTIIQMIKRLEIEYEFTGQAIRSAYNLQVRKVIQMQYPRFNMKLIMAPPVVDVIKQPETSQRDSVMKFFENICSSSVVQRSAPVPEQRPVPVLEQRSAPEQRSVSESKLTMTWAKAPSIAPPKEHMVIRQPPPPPPSYAMTIRNSKSPARVKSPVRVKSPPRAKSPEKFPALQSAPVTQPAPASRSTQASKKSTETREHNKDHAMMKDNEEFL